MDTKPDGIIGPLEEWANGPGLHLLDELRLTFHSAEITLDATKARATFTRHRDADPINLDDILARENDIRATLPPAHRTATIVARHADGDPRCVVLDFTHPGTIEPDLATLHHDTVLDDHTVTRAEDLNGLLCLDYVGDEIPTADEATFLRAATEQLTAKLPDRYRHHTISACIDRESDPTEVTVCGLPPSTDPARDQWGTLHHGTRISSYHFCTATEIGDSGVLHLDYRSDTRITATHLDEIRAELPDQLRGHGRLPAARHNDAITIQRLPDTNNQITVRLTPTGPPPARPRTPLQHLTAIDRAIQNRARKLLRAAIRDNDTAAIAALAALVLAVAIYCASLIIGALAGLIASIGHGITGLTGWWASTDEAALILDPVHAYITAHADGMPEPADRVYNSWLIVGALFWAWSTLTRNTGARIGWTAFGIATTAMTYAATTGPNRPLAAATAAITWCLLSTTALRRRAGHTHVIAHIPGVAVNNKTGNLFSVPKLIEHTRTLRETARRTAEKIIGGDVKAETTDDHETWQRFGTRIWTDSRFVKKYAVSDNSGFILHYAGLRENIGKTNPVLNGLIERHLMAQLPELFPDGLRTGCVRTQAVTDEQGRLKVGEAYVVVTTDLSRIA